MREVATLPAETLCERIAGGLWVRWSGTADDWATARKCLRGAAWAMAQMCRMEIAGDLYWLAKVADDREREQRLIEAAYVRHHGTVMLREA